MLVKMLNNQNCFTMLVAVENSIEHFGKDVPIFHKIKNIISYEPAITLPKNLLKINEKIHPQTCTWMLIAALFITATI